MTVLEVKKVLLARVDALRERVGPAPKRPQAAWTDPVEYHGLMVKYEAMVRNRKDLQLQISTLLGASNMLED